MSLTQQLFALSRAARLDRVERRQKEWLLR
jgi:hypothetical protein